MACQSCSYSRDRWTTRRVGDTAHNLARFYSHIRRQILRAQFENDPRILEEQIELIFSVREAWQQVSSVSESEVSDCRSMRVGLEAASDSVSCGVRSNWSA